jgi:beta-lactamase regulating signal transducer with metallopeptidase domain
MTDTLNAASNGIVAAVLNTFWQTIAVIFLTGAALRLLPGINAATRYFVWWTALAAVALLPFASWLVESGPRTARAAPNAVALPLPAGASVTAVPASVPEPAAPLRLPFEFHVGMWLLAALSLWSSIFLWNLARIAWSYKYLRELKAAARPAPPDVRGNFDEWLLQCRVRRPVRLVVSGEVAAPLAVGFRQPAVILPERLLGEFSGSEMDHVLLHELAHLARRDDWTNLAARFASALFLLHPAAAFVLRRIEREREVACDDWVVATTGEARSYAASLARLFEICFGRRAMILAPGMAGSASQLGDRIEMLLRRGRDFVPQASAARITICVAGLFVFLVAGVQTPRWIAFAQDSIAPPPPLLAQVQPPAAPAAPPPPPKASRAHPGPAPTAPGVPVAPAVPPPPPVPSAPRVPGQPSFLADLVAAGYSDLSVDEIIEMRTQGLSGPFIVGMNQAGWGKLSPKQLIELHVVGVSPEYVRAVRDSGLKDVSLADAIELQVHGVNPDGIREVHALGFGPYTARQEIEFAVQGIQPDFFHALKDAGLTASDPGPIIEAGVHGVGAGDLREAKKYGQNLSLKQIIKMKIAGVI